MLARLPRKIVRIERNAMAAYPRSRVERHESKRLGCGRANHFPGVDIQRVTKARHFIRHANVHRPKSVLEQLSRLGNASRAYGMNIVDDLRIEMSCCRGR